jgi:MoaA/NifB/PqqE/SkfB family radical SAM enzyme
MPNRKTVAVVFLQPQCNMTCRFCITQDGFDRMEARDAQSLLEQLQGQGYTTVVFGGGEPFAWPGDLCGLTREAKTLGFTVQVVTNGIAMPADFARIQTIDRYVLPLEAADASVHDHLRRMPRGSHHALVLDRLQALAAARKCVTLSTVATRHNIDQVPAIGRFLAEHHRHTHHVHAWHIYRFLPHGRGGRRHAAELAVGQAEFVETCERARRLDLPFKLYRRSDMYAPATVEFLWRQGGRLVTGSREWTALPS